MNPTKNYYRVILGIKNIYAEEAYRGNFIGVDYGFDMDLSNKLPENWREFNKEFIPIYLQKNPDKSKVAAGLACGFSWTLAKGLQIGDIVLCPNGKGEYFVGELISNYEYHPEGNLPHRRAVKWFSKTIEKSQMSQALQNSAGSIGTMSNLKKYADEIDALLLGARPAIIITTDETIEDPSVFALEKHLEDFLVKNWHQTELGEKYDIYEVAGELVGQQYPSDTGQIDILAISKDKKELLVVELKKGRISDVVVGQIQRYMGYVKEELAENNQEVKGVIIALEDDLRIRRALSVTTGISFYTYKINFTLNKVS